jgi:cell division septum initiation protein DivIVA
MDKTRRLQLSLNDAQRELARKKLDYDNECMRAAADYEKFAAEREQWEKREGELEQELHERSDTVQSLCIQAQTQNLDACKNLIQVQSSELQGLRQENYNLNQRLRDAEQRLRDQRLRDAETPSPPDSADESAGAANQYHNTRVGDDTWDISRRASPGAFAAHQEAARDLVARDNVVHISDEDNEDPLVEMCEAWNGKRRQDSDSDQQGRNVFPRTAEFLQNAFGSNGAASRDPPVSVNPSFGEGAVPAVAVPAAPGPADGYARDALGRIVIEDGAERC